MRYPPEHKEAVRSKILEHAAQALRRKGLAGVSIPALMKRAGLTHGGFYAHFSDKDELVAAAIERAAEETGAGILSEEAGDLQATLEAYLSVEHTHHPERGCVLAALGTEGVRQKPAVRRAFAHAAKGFLRLIERKVNAQSEPGCLSDDALRIAAQMVGAVMLARLVGDRASDRALATRILEAAKVT